MAVVRRLVLVLLALSLVSAAPPPQFTPEQQALIATHVYGGLPADDEIYVRHGYVMQYIPDYRVPAWSAYYVTLDYLKKPKREGQFSSFRTDPDVTDGVADGEYVGFFKNRGFARGHLAPYAVMGGDRDGDGLYATDGDDYDMETKTSTLLMSGRRSKRSRTRSHENHSVACDDGVGTWVDCAKPMAIWSRSRGRHSVSSTFLL